MKSRFPLGMTARKNKSEGKDVSGLFAALRMTSGEGARPWPRLSEIEGHGMAIRCS
jgi:hypothetical protein